MRVDLYTTIHKAQRFHMFALANAIGCAGPGAQAAASKLVERARRLIEHLRDHAHNEETYIHPLYDRAGHGADSLRERHQGLEADLHEIEQLLASGGNDLYATYTRFLGKYLLHLSEEEDAQKRILWERYDDSTLKAVMDRFNAERPREKAAADLEFMLPALSIAELGRLFRGMKLAVTPSAFDSACNQALRVLGADKWRQVVGSISAD